MTCLIVGVVRWAVRKALPLALLALGLFLLAAERRSSEAGRTIRLARPSVKRWPGMAPWWKLLGLRTTPRGLPEGYTHWAVAREDELTVYGAYGSKAWLWGKVRRGQRVPVKFKKTGDHCKNGNWYSTPDDAYLCNSHGFTISSSSRKVDAIRPPELDRALPYTYLKPKKKPALQYDELPTAEEERAAERALGSESADAMPDAVDSVQEGGFFVAVDRKVKGPTGRFYRTIAGHYVRADRMEVVKASNLRGELLGKGARRLPMAFVHGESAPVYCPGKKDHMRRCGKAGRHARFRVMGEPSHGGKKYVQGPGALLLARADVRVARKTERPSSVAKDEKWVHFDLSQQVLVAYEGDRPVFTSLFSSGKKGHGTPPGTFRLYLKHISARMSGDDPKDGPYDIGEVPWVMYYKGSFAVHGAYWHDVFGEVRSHGCTNVAPADARWLYFWTEPRVPSGWHSMYARKGTVFHFTY